MTIQSELAIDLSERWNGPFSLRLLLQPSMAFLFALRDGRADAKARADPYLRRIFLRPDLRQQTIASAWASIGKVMIIAFILDCAFQLVSTRTASLGEAVFMSFLLCAVPYTMMRGPAARFLGK